jgi:hypothetical protein
MLFHQYIAREIKNKIVEFQANNLPQQKNKNKIKYFGVASHNTSNSISNSGIQQKFCNALNSQR